MYCPKCGAKNSEKNETCENCGYFFTERESKEIVTGTILLKRDPQDASPAPKRNKTATLSAVKKYLPNLIFLTAVFVLLLSITGAVCLFIGGARISDIHSVGGKTLEEAYYSRLQLIYHGFAFFVLSMGVFMSGTLSFFGFFLRKETQKRNDANTTDSAEFQAPSGVNVG